MQPTTIEALVIVALVLSPGYLFTQVVRRLIAHVPETTDLRYLLTVITWGTVIQAVAFPLWTIRILGFYLDGQLRQHQLQAFLWAVVVCLVLPIGLGVAVGRLTLWPRVDKVLDTFGLGYVDRMPSAWDYIVREPSGSWVRIHLTEGHGVVAGKFGDHSVASLDPKRADVYLEEEWLLDENGNFAEPVVDSRGVWVAHDVMAYVEFLDRWEESGGTPSVEHDDETHLDVEARDTDRRTPDLP